MKDKLNTGMYSTTKVEAITYIATIHFDDTTSVDDYDCYDTDTIAAWNTDDWHFFGIVVTAERDGWEKTISSIWGIEGFSNKEYIDSLVAELISESEE